MSERRNSFSGPTPPRPMYPDRYRASDHGYRGHKRHAEDEHPAPTPPKKRIPGLPIIRTGGQTSRDLYSIPRAQSPVASGSMVAAAGPSDSARPSGTDATNDASGMSPSSPILVDQEGDGSAELQGPGMHDGHSDVSDAVPADTEGQFWEGKPYKKCQGLDHLFNLDRQVRAKVDRTIKMTREQTYKLDSLLHNARDSFNNLEQKLDQTVKSSELSETVGPVADTLKEVSKASETMTTKVSKNTKKLTTFMRDAEASAKDLKTAFGVVTSEMISLTEVVRKAILGFESDLKEEKKENSARLDQLSSEVRGLKALVEELQDDLVTDDCGSGSDSDTESEFEAPKKAPAKAPAKALASKPAKALAPKPTPVKASKPAKATKATKPAKATKPTKAAIAAAEKERERNRQDRLTLEICYEQYAKQARDAKTPKAREDSIALMKRYAEDLDKIPRV